MDTDRSELIEEYLKLDIKVRDFDTRPVRTYLELTRTACGTSWYPTEKQEAEAYGPEITSALQLIEKACEFNWSDIYGKMNDIHYRIKCEKPKVPVEKEICEAKNDDPLIAFFEQAVDATASHNTDVTVAELESIMAEMKQWLTRTEKYMAAMRVKIALIETVIDRKAETIRELESTDAFKKSLAAVNDAIVAHHDRDASIRDRGRHCYLLYNDGEIVSTKSGADLFLNRSIFNVQPPIAGINPTLFTFPEKWHNGKGITYIIVADSGIAGNLRNKMLELYGMLAQPIAI